MSDKVGNVLLSFPCGRAVQTRCAEGEDICMMPMIDELKILACIRSARWEGRLVTSRTEFMFVLNVFDDKLIDELIERMKANRLIAGGTCDIYRVLDKGIDMLKQADKQLLDSTESEKYVEAWHKLRKEME